ncbi:MAG: hypothetical protein HPY50_01145 [Firmicutes bacterium]|nr:hypothetical protein [Bacillota bacterium]
MIARFFLFLGEMTGGAVFSKYLIEEYSRETALGVFLTAAVIYWLLRGRKKKSLDMVFLGVGVLAVTALEGLKVALAVWVAVRILGLGNRTALPAALLSLPIFTSFIYPDDLLLTVTTLAMVTINRHLFSLRLI